MTTTTSTDTTILDYTPLPSLYTLYQGPFSYNVKCASGTSQLRKQKEAVASIFTGVLGQGLLEMPERQTVITELYFLIFCSRRFWDLDLFLFPQGLL